LYEGWSDSESKTAGNMRASNKGGGTPTFFFLFNEYYFHRNKVALKYTYELWFYERTQLINFGVNAFLKLISAYSKRSFRQNEGPLQRIA
jgi:hypothetical protein